MRKLEVADEIVEAGERRARFGLDHGPVDRIADEPADRIERLPERDRDELDLVACGIADGPLQQIGAAVPFDRGQPGKDSGGHKMLMIGPTLCNGCGPIRDKAAKSSRKTSLAPL